VYCYLLTPNHAPPTRVSNNGTGADTSTVWPLEESRIWERHQPAVQRKVLSKFFLVSMRCGAIGSLKNARNETMTGHSAPLQTTDSKRAIVSYF
jgi:hypothetical protein